MFQMSKWVSNVEATNIQTYNCQDTVSQRMPHHGIDSIYGCSGKKKKKNREHFRWPSGVCLHLSKLLITRHKSKNYTSSLKCTGPVFKGSIWGWWCSWAQHLESLSSTTEVWWKTNVSTSPPLHCTPSESPAAGPGCVYSGQDELLATARSTASTLTFDPYSEGQGSSQSLLWILQPLYLQAPPVI